MLRSPLHRSRRVGAVLAGILLIGMLGLLGAPQAQATHGGGIRIAGVGASFGHRAADDIPLDIPGSTVDRISEATFNAMSVSDLLAAYDVLLITWASSPSLNADWDTRLAPFIAGGGGVVWEDPNNLGDIASHVGAASSGGSGSGITVTQSVPGLTDGVNDNQFVNFHLRITSMPAGMQQFLASGSNNVGAFEPGFVITGPDQDFHAKRNGSAVESNQYRLLLNAVQYVHCPSAGAPNQDPTVAADNGAITTDEGTPAGNTGTYGDPDGDTVTLSASTGTLVDNNDGTWTWSNAAPDGPDAYTVTVTADDGNGGTASTSFGVTVRNVAPTVDLTGPASVDESTTATHTYSFTSTDPGDDTYALVGISCGTNGVLSSPAFNAADGSGSFDCTFADGDNSSDVSVQVEDSDGADSNVDVITVAIANVAPTVEAGPDQATTFGGTISLDGSFADPGADADWTVAIDWGDGSDQSTTAGATGAITDSHQYLSLGVHTVTVCVTDKDGSETCDTTTVTVTNTEGKVTGGVSTIDGAGRGGFNVQNKRGVISGQLQFRDASTRFHASEMTALAVSDDGTSAWFGGVGKDGRPFVAYVEDNGEPGAADLFRIWIDGVLHGGSGAMAGGNIQIHQK